MRHVLAATLLLALPAAAQQAEPEFDCPPDVAADSPQCVPEAGLVSQIYAIGDVLSEEVPLDMADREDMPPLEPGEAFATLGDRLLRVEVETRVIRDVLDVLPSE